MSLHSPQPDGDYAGGDPPEESPCCGADYDSLGACRDCGLTLEQWLEQERTEHQIAMREEDDSE